jgi:hypothetical protein
VTLTRISLTFALCPDSFFIFSRLPTGGERPRLTRLLSAYRCVPPHVLDSVSVYLVGPLSLCVLNYPSLFYRQCVSAPRSLLSVFLLGPLTTQQGVSLPSPLSRFPFTDFFFSMLDSV